MNFVDKFINLKEEGGKSERDREFVFFLNLCLGVEELFVFVDNICDLLQIFESLHGFVMLKHIHNYTQASHEPIFTHASAYTRTHITQTHPTINTLHILLHTLFKSSKSGEVGGVHFMIS